MVEIALEGPTIRARDPAGNTVSVDTVGWDSGSTSEKSLPYQMDAVVTGRAVELSLKSIGHTESAQLDVDGRMKNQSALVDQGGETELPDDQNLVRVDSSLHVVIRFDAPAVLTQDSESTADIVFEQPTAVTIAFLSLEKYPRNTITVPRTTGGIATALSHASSAILDETPVRAAPASRGHPPLIQFGPTTDIPEEVAKSDFDLPIEIHLPDTLRALFPAAPLTYYLGATVKLSDIERPRLSDTENALDYRFSSLPEFQHEAASLLRRVFYLDNLVRYDQFMDLDSPDLDLFSLLAFDPEMIADAPIGERVRQYLEVDYADIEPALPPWHSLTYIEPTYRNARALPYILADLQQVYLPDAGSTSSSNAIPRGAGANPEEPAHCVDHYRAPFVGRLTQSKAESGYNAHLDAYENKTSFLGSTQQENTVILAHTDGDRAAQTAAEIYKADTGLPIELRELTNPTRVSLASAIEEGCDLLHVIGGYDDGFDCCDGTLCLDDISTSNVRMLYLDGPATMTTANRFLESGSVVCFVQGHYSNQQPTESDPDEFRRQFLRLLTTGHTVDQARRYAMQNTSANESPLRVYGDATVLLSHSPEYYLAPTHIEPLENGLFRLTIDTELPEIGYMYSIPLAPYLQLTGKSFELTVDAEGIRTLLSDMETVIQYDGEFYRNSELQPFYPLV